MPSEQEVEGALDAIGRLWRDGASVELRAAIRAALDAAARIRAPASFQCPDGEALKAQHRLRALDAIATERCTSDLTNGFCSPQGGECRRHSATGRSCVAQAEACLRALEGRGMSVVWDFDPTLIITMEKQP